MAIKRECDRCGKQWVPEESPYGDGGDIKLAVVTVKIPANRGVVAQKSGPISKSYDLCQSCGRQVNDFMQTIGKVASNGEQPQHKG